LTPRTELPHPFATMTPELHQLIIRSKFHVGAVRAVAALLPAEDAALDALVGERAQANDTYGFGYVVTAAVDAGRPVDARHLATGAMLIQNQHVLGCVAWHMQGEVPEPLLHAIEHTLLFPVVESAMLLLIADWCREHGGRALPAGFIPHARHFARKTNLNTEALGYLLALAQIAGDAGLKSVVETHFVKRSPEKLQKARDSARVLGEAFLNVCRGPISALFPAAPPRVLAEKFTMRRAVARVGRNEPCPCGSGKKYKHCCIEKDVERLHFSTDVAGKTIEEVQAEPEPHLNLSKLM
jgi:hypothetical protein